MFRRRWKWFGDLVSDEGFTLKFGYRSVEYTDEHGSFGFGMEDEWLFPKPWLLTGEPAVLDQAQLDVILDRIIRGSRSEGKDLKVYSE
jgi:hypothetical protein